MLLCSRTPMGRPQTSCTAAHASAVRSAGQVERLDERLEVRARRKLIVAGDVQRPHGEVMGALDSGPTGRRDAERAQGVGESAGVRQDEHTTRVQEYRVERRRGARWRVRLRPQVLHSVMVTQPAGSRHGTSALRPTSSR
jgi:hypothetical protein